jgi:hypothetical protein
VSGNKRERKREELNKIEVIEREKREEERKNM